MPEKQYFTGIDIINAPRIESLTVTEDGTYTASSDVIGYNPVVVNTNQPWQPLEDGYSNFWFELTNDTLSPWLNFSAKTEDAVIDWGDGSGEVALDTLTPTHTYAKAGKYVVKVKGVTGIAQQNTMPYNSTYFGVINNVELNSEVTALANQAFWGCTNLENVKTWGTISSCGGTAFSYCGGLKKAEINISVATFPAIFAYCFALRTFAFSQSVTSIPNNAFIYNISINNITIPSGVSSIGNSAFGQCYSMTELHCQATTPPTLGSTVFNNMPSGWICYVPVGYGETYKSAAGWSTYADHILEEGQTPNRAMLSRLAKAADTDTDNEEMR